MIIAEMEEAGWITRVMIDPDKPHLGRAGILAKKRLDDDLPVADDPPSPEQLERIRPVRKRSPEEGPRVKIAPPALFLAHPALKQRPFERKSRYR